MSCPTCRVVYGVGMEDVPVKLRLVAGAGVSVAESDFLSRTEIMLLLGTSSARAPAGARLPALLVSTQKRPSSNALIATATTSSHTTAVTAAQRRDMVWRGGVEEETRKRSSGGFSAAAVEQKRVCLKRCCPVCPVAVRLWAVAKYSLRDT